MKTPFGRLGQALFHNNASSHPRQRWLRPLVVLFVLIASSITSYLITLQHVHAASNYTQYVNPFIGTDASNTISGGASLPGDGQYGQGFPGSALPFALAQFSPDTTDTDEYHNYNYQSSTITGFSMVHGANFTAISYIPFLPYIGEVTSSPGTNAGDYYAGFSHANEQASPGYYAVTLNSGVKVELTSTTRTGFGQFTFPATTNASVIMNTSSSIENTNSSVNLNPGSNEVTGQEYIQGQGSTIYFAAQFSQPFASYGTWNGGSLAGGSTSSAATQAGAYVTFNTTQNQVVQVKVGISYVSVANAQANLQAELLGPNLDFGATVNAAQTTWNNLLGRVAVSDGSTNDLTLFYSNLYYAFQQPHTYSDVNGQYEGWDHQVHTVASGHTEYSDISIWDSATGQLQLQAWVLPNETSDIMQSYVDATAQGDGFVQRVVYESKYCGCNAGDLGGMALAYAFGARNFDTGTALHQLVNTATNPTNNSTRAGLSFYLSNGYVASDQVTDYPAYNAMSYYASDYAVSQMASALGDSADAATLLARAAHWHNQFDTQLTDGGNTGFVWSRNSSDAFDGGFSSGASGGCYGAFYEGSSGQYTWEVPQDFAGLFAAMGGNAIAIQRLDSFFTQQNSGCASPYMYIGNETDFQVPWAYDWAGAPWRTQDVVRKIALGNFSNTPQGLPGNNDGGATSSWFVWSALGLFPAIPGVGGFALSSPLFSSATISLENGNTVQINGTNASEGNEYIQSATLNGNAYDSPWLPLGSIANGGTLSFTLGSNFTTWGSTPSSNPPPSITTTTLSSQTIKIVNNNDNKCLGISGNGTDNNINADQYDCVGAPSQAWHVVPQSNGSYYIVNNNSNRCLSINYNSTANSVYSNQYDCVGAPSQYWSFQQVGNGLYHMVNNNSEKCLGISGNNTANNTLSDQYDCVGAPSQYWSFQ